MGALLGGGAKSTTDQKISTIRIQSSAQGLPIPLLYGLTRASPNMIWYSDFTSIPHTESQGGGKGGGGPTNTSFTYTASVMMGIGEGPILTVPRVWRNKDVVTTANLSLTLFEGNYPQTAWSYLTTNHANEALTYQGTAYAASSALDLGSDASTPNLSFEVGGLLYAGCSDINVADVITDILTATHYGAGFTALGNIAVFSDYCQAANWRVAPAYTSQRPAAEMIAELADIANSGIVWSENTLKIIPYAEEEITGNATSGSFGNVPATTRLQSYFNSNSTADISAFSLGNGTLGGDAVVSGGLVVNNANASINQSLTYTSADLGATGEDYLTIELYITWLSSPDVSYLRFLNYVYNDALPGSTNLSLGFYGEDGLVVFNGNNTIAISGRTHIRLVWGPTSIRLYIAGAEVYSQVTIGPPAPGTSGTVYLAQDGYTDAIPLSYTIDEFAIRFREMNTGNFTPPANIEAPDGDGQAAVCNILGPVTFTPDLTPQYDLGYSDFLAEPGSDPIKVTRKRQADAYNQVQIECLDRADNYNPAVVQAQDQWNVATYGLRPKDKETLHAINDPAIARAMAQIKLNRALYQRNRYAFTLGWRYARLEPMDIVTLTDPKLGLDETPVRILEVEESDAGDLSITAEDLLVGVSSSASATTGNAVSYPVQTASGFVPNRAAVPGDTAAPVIFQPPLGATGGVNQLWIGASGGEEWGGANVWASADGDSYAQMGTLTAPAKYGELTANFPAAIFPAATSPDTTSTLSVDLSASNGSLTAVAQSAADAEATLCYVGPQASCELIAFTEATLTAPYEYDLDTYIARGLQGSAPAAHSTGATFLRVDAAVGRFDIPDAQLGTTVYVKLPAFNRTGGALQDISNCVAYPFGISAAAPSESTSTSGTPSLTLEEGVWGMVTAGGDYFGIGRESRDRVYQHSAVDGSLIASSFSMDGNGAIAGLVTDGAANVWTSSAEWLGTYYGGSSVYRIETSNLSVAAAQYNAPVPGVQAGGIAYDGAVIWISDFATQQIVQLNAATLAVEASYNVPVNLSGLAYANGSLYSISYDSSDPRVVKWNTTSHAITWNEPCVGPPRDILVSGDFVYVAANSEIGVYRTSDGSEVTTKPASAPSLTGQRAALADFGQYVLGTDSATPLSSTIVQFDASTGLFLRNLDVQAAILGGADIDAQTYFVTRSPTNSYDNFKTYGYKLFLTSAVQGVGLTMPSIFTTGNAVTTTGNLTATLATQNAAVVFAGPAAGNAATPTFRALAATDFNSGANASANTVLHGDLVWRAVTVGGNATQNAATVYAGPLSGNAAAPAFRALAGGDMPRLTINTQTANYTLALADANVAYVRINNTSNLVVTVPSNANAAFANGTSVLISRANTGTVTIAAQANVTVANASSNTLRAQNSVAALVYTGDDRWDLFGDTT